MTSPSENLGARLRELIASKGMTNVEFARKLQITPQQLSRWLGYKTFQWDQIRRFCDALEVSEVTFLGLNSCDSE